MSFQAEQHAQTAAALSAAGIAPAEIARLLHIPEPEPMPGNFQGWTLTRDRDGYVRAHRKIAGRRHTLYIGKVWDSARAAEKIAERGR